MKRTIPAALVGFGIAFVAGGAFADGELHIYNWGDYTSPDVIKKFEQTYNVKVTLDSYDSNDQMIAKVKAYWHKWQTDHMVIWDNRRMLHAVGGCDPKFERRMQRTTIRGDYGIGYFEDGKKIGEVQREFVA